MNRKFYKRMCCITALAALLTVTLVTSHHCIAQEVFSKVHYKFKHIDDTTQPDNPYVEDVVVFLTPKATIQKSFIALELRAAVKAFVYNQNRTVNASGAAVFESPTIDKDISLYEYYHDYDDRESYLFAHLFDTYYAIPYDFPEIDWTLLDESKEIGGFICQLAQGEFGGRTYFVWFTPELPFPFGPWKLHGLPGLILEANDEHNEVSWTFYNLEAVATEKTERLITPKDAVRTTQDKFEKTFESVKRNPDAARKASTAAAKSAGGFGIKMDNSLLTEYYVGREKKIGYTEKTVNNPIELTK